MASSISGNPRPRRTEDAAKNRDRSSRRDRLLAIVVVVVVAFALKLTQSVTLPLAFGLFLAAVTWPIYSWISRRLPRGLGAVAALLSFLAVIGGIGWAVAESVEQVVEKAPQYSERVTSLTSGAKDSAEKYGFTLPDSQSLQSSGRDLAMRLSRGTLGFFGAAVLVCAFMVLGLLEISDSSKKLGCSKDAGRWKRIAHRVARDFQRYIVVRTLLGLLNGALATIGLMLIGVDLALLWGLLTFILNYIPTIGSIVATVPPVLFALVTDGPSTALLALLIAGGLQLVLGNWIDPLVQGRYLELSPLVVLFSVVFWGWVWGVAGAFIGVPLTIVIVLICREFESTRFIAVMLARAEQAEELGEEPLRGEPGGQRVPV